MANLSSKLYIGLVGEKGSGKGTFVETLQGIFPITPIGHIHFSDPIVETLNLWGIPITRKNAQDYIKWLEQRYGTGILAQLIKGRALESAAQIVALDGIRWWQDVKMLRELPNNILVYITAPTELRFERLKKRNEKVGEAEMSWEQFLEEEKAENEIYIPEIGEKADYKILNDKNEEKWPPPIFKNEILKFCAKKLMTI
jgi:dephospho-CoA kinase